MEGADRTGGHGFLEPVWGGGAGLPAGVAFIGIGFAHVILKGMCSYDAVLVVSFGGPEGREEVTPFLENVLRGKNVPRARLLEVAEHYYHFGGVSPINGQNRALIAALQARLDEAGPRLPVYWGNRNWHPLLADTLRRMARDGIRRAIAFVTSAYSSYSSCRQYLEDIARARSEVGDRAPEIDKLGAFYNRPGFLEAMADRVGAALARLPGAELVFTAHSIPLWMAQGCFYETQLQEAARRVAGAVGRDGARVVYQSRTGPPGPPWLEPDICDWLRAERPLRVVIVPIGFLSDHMEVIYDLDTQAGQVCHELGIQMVRAGTAGDHPRFVEMIRELIVERIEKGPGVDLCPPDCCPLRPPRAVV
jgi:ferrochelatase